MHMAPKWFDDWTTWAGPSNSGLLSVQCQTTPSVLHQSIDHAHFGHVTDTFLNSLVVLIVALIHIPKMKSWVCSVLR